jgi:hypothetical protein
MRVVNKQAKTEKFGCNRRKLNDGNEDDIKERGLRWIEYIENQVSCKRRPHTDF